jgi:hypothetical protein
MVKKLFERRIIAIFFLNIGFVILFSGCFSSLHQGQVTDGYSVALAFLPVHHEFESGGFAKSEVHDIRASMALRRGRVPSKKGETGHSIGIRIDLDAPKKRDDPDIIVATSASIRGSYYHQFPKNSFLDAGIGGEFGIVPPVIPLIPYAVISRNLGPHFTLYSEVRAIFPGPFDNYSIAPTLGAKFDISKYSALFVEMNLFIHSELRGCKLSEYGISGAKCTTQRVASPVIGVGIMRHGWSEKKPMFDDDGNVITEEEIRANMRLKKLPIGGCLGGCLGGSSVWLLFIAIAYFEPPEELFIILMPIGILAGSFIGDLIDENRDRKQAIERIKAQRRQQKQGALLEPESAGEFYFRLLKVTF